ncbi:protoporphyrinogen oxidase [Eupeodes corollae]|uniref:protoporphyrinogen oxidase n=1 Tax=Eupeodes corollae TaxID=290404 RepID=UPI0024912D7A|nr:protoporphyrinogen oxidase [Eupeodes corollae]XP_055905522.1 protoporphyrinogen oxidase [Eupeodes corollae]
MPAVLGGGIGGLSAAYYLTRRYVNPVTVYESSNRLGGWIRSENHYDENFIFEAGPRTIRTKGPAASNTLELMEELNLNREIYPICDSHPAARNRMVYAKGQLCMLPNSLMGAFKTLPPFTKPLISALFHDLRAGSKIQKNNDESMYDFVHRRFGKEIADYAISPMICGICAGNAKEISVRFLMNDLFDWEQKYGGVIKGLLFRDKKKANKKQESGVLPKLAKDQNWSIYSIKGGLEMLPITLGGYLTNYSEIKLNSKCQNVSFHKDNTAEVRINGTNIPTDHVVSSLPAFKLAKAVELQHPDLADRLNKIQYVDVAVVNLQYRSPDLLEQEAFGFLVPPIENLPILGVIFDSCCFNMRGNTVLTCMMGGHWFEKLFGKNPTEKDILDVALKNVRDILGIEMQPKTSRVHILRKCIPQYTVGHKARVDGIRDYVKKHKLPLTLCGSAFDGVGVNDVILSSRIQVDQIVGSK